MDFILGTVAPFVFEHSIGPIKRHVTYPFNYKSNIRSLEEGLKELKGDRDRVQHSVDDDERNGKVTEQDVRDWLQDVREIIEKEEAELVVANETTKKKCCLGFCPNLKTRYQVSKKAEQKAGDVAKLSRKRERFSTLSHTVALQWNGAFSIKDFEALESRLSDLKNIMSALTRFGVNTVGVYGVGGVGKTTLAREVGRKAKEEKLFDKVVMATVTAEVNVKNIQAQIADVLGLKFDVESEGGRASQLCERLKKEKKLLIILDDLWEKLDLKAVGIPSQDEHDGSKLLLTSRDLEILSNAMDSKENFPIGALAENEAWDLFKKMANNSFQDLDLAMEVAKVCAGLPIAIVTVASSLKSKSLAEWRNALKELHTISSPGLTKIQATIEFSYNKLENRELQSTFLLCSQMGYDATIEDLLKYGMGLDLFDVSNLEEAQDRVCSLVQRLKTFCLLLEGNSKKQLLMHDVVRDVGRRIAFRDQGVIVLKDKNNPKRWADEDKLKTYTRIWLCSNAKELLEEMQCPKLVFIHIDGNNGDLKIPDNLFKGLDKLRVLSLTSFYFSSLPPSLGLLENLKTLCFYRSLELGDIRIVGELKKLEVLSFARSNIRELPREIGELTELKLLDLSDCGKLEVIPSNVLSKLCRLEELYMGGSFDRWETEGGDGASLIELKRLEFLTNLEIRIRDPYSIPKGIFSEKLRRYRLLIGEGISSTWKSENETLKRLKLKLDAKVNVLEGVLQLLKGTEHLYLYGVRNLLCELDSEGFPRLKHFCLCDSPGVQYIVEVTESAPYVAFPMLESLILENLVSLEKICQYRPKMQTFNNLRLVQVRGCSKLTYLFSSLVAQGLSQLREIEVDNCESMEEIVGEGSIVAHTTKGEATKTITFSQLHLLYLRSLPKLRCFCSNAKQQCLSKRKSSKLLEANLKEDMEIPLVPLFNDQILFPNLEKLYLLSINNETLWGGRLTNTRIEDSFQKLVELTVSDCANLKYLFSPSLVKCLPQLKILVLRWCNAMEEVIGAEDDQQCMNNEVILFPKLQYLALLSLAVVSLPRLERFCKNHILECPLLTDLEISSCHALKTFIGQKHQEVRMNEMSQNATQTQRPPLFGEMVVFPSLAKLSIDRMDSVEKIWHNQVATPSFCELRDLSINRCKKLTKVFPSILAGRFQKLEVLSVKDSEWVENIFEIEESKDDAQYGMISFELKELRLSGLPKLKQIWSRDPEGLVTFPNLQSVTVDGCEALKNVFPFSIATNLPLLNNIDMEGCGVEEIVANAKTNGEAAAATAPAPRFLLPELTTLKLLRVSKLTSWMHTLLLPKLKVLYMDRLNFNGKVVFNSEELLLDGKLGKDSNIWRDHFPATLKLHVQNLDADNWDGIPSGFLQEFHNLEELVVNKSALEYLFSFDGSDDAAAADTQRLPRLKHLKAERLSGLRHMIYEQSNHVSHLSLLFRSLETLEVKWCESLVSVAPSSTTVTFQNLTSLILCGCHKLLYIITTLTAKSLTNLVKLEVSECDMVTEIVQGKEGELDAEEEDKVVFAKLQSLKLIKLMSLTSFCSGNYGFRFPYLNEVKVRICPKMKVFSPGLLRTPKLRDVYFNENGKCWEGNLNDTIRKLHNQLVGYEGMEWLTLSEFPDLQQIWHGPLPVKSFIQLRILEVDECSFFSTAVPFNLMPCLVNLRQLSVSKCDSVEGVFDLERLLLNADDVPNHHDGIQLLLPKLYSLVLSDLPRLNNIFPNQHHRRGVLEFRNLSELELHNCSSLKNIFTPSMALCLVNLYCIEIRNCIAIEEIITKENAGEAVSKVQDLIFPKLREIVLESLPNLINFNSGDGIVDFSYLNEITVENCPNMKPFISSFLRGQVPRAVDETKEQRLDNHEIQPAATTSLIDDGDDKVAYPELKILRMDWNDTMEEIGHGQVKAEFFCQLQTLKIINLLRFPNVEELTLQNALFKEIIPHERTNGEDTGTGALPKLRELTLSKLPNLMHLAKESSSLCSTFQNLEKLSILDCGMLETLVLLERTNGEDTGTGALPMLRDLTLSKLPKLMHLAKEGSSSCETFQNLKTLRFLECGILETVVPSTASFQSLTTLEVSKCPKLLHFMTSTAAKSLVLLTRMSIAECPMLEQIVESVENGHGAENIGITFSRLKCLELHCLPNLLAFSFWNCAFTFPSLNDVVVRVCPKMKIFSQAAVTTPKLRRVRQMEGKEKWCWEGSLNATIQKLSTSNLLDVEAGQPEKNEKSPVSVGPTTEDFQKSKILSPHVITEHTETENVLQPDQDMPTLVDISSFSKSQMDTPTDQVKTTPTSSTEQSGTFPESSASTEAAITPTSRSANRTPSSGQLTSSQIFAQTSNTQSFQISESLNSGFESYDYCISVMKKILSKPLTEVASSTDRFSLLSTLKNLNKCDLLNSQQLEAIQAYIDNFESLVTHQAFYETQIKNNRSVLFSIEDKKKRIMMLKNHYEDLSRKSASLGSDKEALIKRLREIEDKETQIREDMEDIGAKIAVDDGNLEAEWNFLPEFEREQREAEDKVTYGNGQWAKMRNLFP